MIALPSADAIQLINDGTVALSQVESNGVKIDTEYLEKAIRRARRRIEHHKNDLEDDEILKTWKKTYRTKFKFSSSEQLGHILFNEMGYECHSWTATGRPKTDEKSLRTVDSPFVQKYLEIKKLEKALSTYLLGIKKETDADGFCHPTFNLHLTRTYRSSSQAPNFQNMPVRDPKIGKLVRSAIVARPGGHIVEVDYSGIEVSVAACYHKDPTMIADIVDPERDMHRDMAAECFKLPPEDVTKMVRYCGKNMFVFPQFYGSWYMECAKNLWGAMAELKLETKDGRPMREHLKRKGIRKLGDCKVGEKPKRGTFEKHIQEVEDRFWNERYPQYTAWKKKWLRQYKKKGWIKTKTGFICRGFMVRNEIINYAIQGAAFHVLLYALTLLQKQLMRRKMNARIIGQIHDSIVADVPADELQDYLTLVRKVTTGTIPRRWPWIVVPLDVEAEVAPFESNWSLKEEWVPVNGIWQPAKG
jgi:DNA polymerase-1